MPLDLADFLILTLTGLAAGALNAAVGSGTLITYPALLAIGLPPVVANGTNSLGMAPGNLAAAYMYRGELKGRRDQLEKWVIATAAGGLIGALLVVLLPSRVFEVVVPWLILSACLVIAIQPLITRWLQGRHAVEAITPVVGLVGIYGGYFGAGQGVAYLAALGSLDDGGIQRANAVKNLLAAAANGCAAVTFLVAGRVVLLPALVVAVAATAGGLIGGGVAKRLPAWLLRSIVIVVGIFAAIMSLMMS